MSFQILSVVQGLLKAWLDPTYSLDVGAGILQGIGRGRQAFLARHKRSLASCDTVGSKACSDRWKFRLSPVGLLRIDGAARQYNTAWQLTTPESSVRLVSNFAES